MTKHVRRKRPLVTRFAEIEIELPRGATGQVRALCPHCAKEGHTKKSLSVNVEDGLWLCFRCGWSGNLSGRQNPPSLGHRKGRSSDRLTDAQENARIEANLILFQADEAEDHPYLHSKGVRPYGLKVQVAEYREIDEERGNEWRVPADSLLVPLQNSKGKILSLQYITRDGEKFFLKDGRTKGCFHLLGEITERVYIAEGYATGASVHEATGEPVVIAFNCGNLLPVAQAIRKKYPEVEIVFAADNDQWTDGNPGVRHASAAARAVSGLLAVPDFADTVGEPTDFNDLHALEGLEEVRRQLANPDPPEPSEPDEIVDRMNRKHAVIDLGGKTRVLTEGRDKHTAQKTVTFSTREDFKARYEHRRYAGTERKSEAEYWLEHPDRRQYDEIGFYPGAEAPLGTYNTWAGFAVKAAPGSCERFLEHVRENIAGGDDEIYTYILAWLANIVQQPMNRPGTALALTGKQGTGKGVFATEIGKLFGRHFAQITNKRQLTGRFNAIAKEKVLLFVDEVSFADRGSGLEMIRAFITEPQIVLELKGIDAFHIDNHCRLILASNDPHFLAAAPEERRFLVMEVADNHMQDHAYFEAIAEEMDNGGREALLDYLLSYELDGINLREIPQTEELLNQKLSSLPPVAAFIYQWLLEGGQTPHRETFEEPIVKELLYNAFSQHCERVGTRWTRGSASFGRELKKIFTDLREGQRREHDRKMCYLFPPLEQCRRIFEAYVRHNIEWPQTEEEPWAENVIPMPRPGRRVRRN